MQRLTIFYYSISAAMLTIAVIGYTQTSPKESKAEELESKSEPLKKILDNLSSQWKKLQ
jgi:hypothetical protein